MPSDLQPILYAVGGLLVSLAILSTRKKTPLPPGPRGLPLIGNVLQMPREYQWVTFEEWSKRWGDIMSVSVLGQRLIILSSFEAANVLLNKRSMNTSSRPPFPMMGELVGWKDALTFMPIGDRFRRLRKEIHALVGTAHNMSKHYSVITEEAKELLVNMLMKLDNSHTQVDPLIRRFFGSITMRLTYGYQVRSEDDRFIQLNNEALRQFSVASTPGAFLVDILPILKYVPEWFPGASFKRTAKAWSKTREQLVSLPMEFLRKEIEAGTAKPSFVGELFNRLSIDDPERDYLAAWTGMSVFTGGIDSTSGTLYAFFLAMLLYPEVLKKAQKELDEQVGSGRLPDYNDRPNLPYINAIILETYRWHPMAPLGLPHRVVEDDVYNGYLIPKGSLILGNQRQMLHDPEVYHSPDEFKPERFLGPNPEQNPMEIAFGFGRRVCPGDMMAHEILFISVAMILAVFDITKVVRDGKAIQPEQKGISGILNHLNPFECKVTPRSEEARRLILNE